jgi:hypothetical protein
METNLNPSVVENREESKFKIFLRRSIGSLSVGIGLLLLTSYLIATVKTYNAIIQISSFDVNLKEVLITASPILMGVYIFLFGGIRVINSSNKDEIPISSKFFYNTGILILITILVTISGVPSMLMEAFSETSILDPSYDESNEIANFFFGFAFIFSMFAVFVEYMGWMCLVIAMLFIPIVEFGLTNRLMKRKYKKNDINKDAQAAQTEQVNSTQQITEEQNLEERIAATAAVIDQPTENTNNTSIEEAKKDPLWRNILKIFIGVLLLLLGVSSVLLLFETNNEIGVLLAYICLFGGIRVIKSSSQDEIPILVKFLFNVGILFIIVFPVRFVLGDFISNECFVTLISTIVFALIVELGLTNRLIKRMYNRMEKKE